MSRLALCGLALVLLFATPGCDSGSETDALYGSFEATLTGAVEATLTGRAVFTRDIVSGDDALTVTLLPGARAVPDPLATRFLSVVFPSVPDVGPSNLDDSPASPLVFYTDLQQGETQTSRSGTLRIQRVDEERVDGTFEATLGRFPPSPDDDATAIEVRATFEAVYQPNPFITQF